MSDTGRLVLFLRITRRNPKRITGLMVLTTPDSAVLKLKGMLTAGRT